MSRVRAPSIALSFSLSLNSFLDYFRNDEEFAMSYFQAFILGIVQGITEFLPISSSGHLKLIELLLGLDNLEAFVSFDLFCHLGTLFAIFTAFYKDIWYILSKDRKKFFLIILATLPLVPLYFILKPIKTLYGMPQYLGFFFLVSSLLLFLGEHFSKERHNIANDKKNKIDALIIGLAQAIAILPAVSRSGATIAAARFLGWERQNAAKFSFFLAIPTIFGGLMIEGREIYKTGFQNISIMAYAIGFLSAFLVGFFVLKILLKMLKKMSLKPFSAYLFIIGIFTIIYTTTR
jgi:undecaprenyl-diphosphatase